MWWMTSGGDVTDEMVGDMTDLVAGDVASDVADDMTSALFGQNDEQWPLFQQ